MPVNATPEYEKAEQRYRAATTVDEQLACLREMLRLIPKHKGSEKVQSDLKRRISSLSKQTAGARKKTGGFVDPYHITPSGAGQVALVGLPNTGKSAIVAAVSHAPVKVGDYPFSTTMPIPGMWALRDVQIQLVDTPPMTPEHVVGGLVNLMRLADVVVVVADAASPESLDQIEVVLELLAARDIELFDRPAREIPPDKPKAKPGLLAVTHSDAVGPEELDALAELLGGRLTICGLDCQHKAGFEEFGEAIWRLMDVIRVYTKRPGQKAAWTDPYTLPSGATIENLARTIHRDLPEKLKSARIWGAGRHDGQQVHRTEVLRDRDMVEIHE